VHDIRGAQLTFTIINNHSKREPRHSDGGGPEKVADHSPTPASSVVGVRRETKSDKQSMNYEGEETVGPDRC